MLGIWSNEETEPYPIATRIFGADDGGFVSVTAALRTDLDVRTDEQTSAGRDNGKHLVLALAAVSRDGIVDLRVSATSMEHLAEFPDDMQLQAMATTCHESGRFPDRFQKLALDWQRVRHSGAIYHFAQDGMISVPGGKSTYIGEFDVDRILDRFTDIVKTEGTLARSLSRHHADVMRQLAIVSTDSAWATEVIRARPWMPVNWLDSRWRDDDMTVDSLTADRLADIISRKNLAAGSVSSAAIEWSDRFFTENAAVVPHTAFMALLTALPRSWWPSNVEDYVALNIMAPRLFSLCDFDAAEAVDMLRPSKGRFADYFSEIGKGLRPLIYGDNSRAFIPGTKEYAIKRRQYFERVESALADCNDLLVTIDTELVSPFRGPPTADDTLKVARRLVTRGGGMRRFAEASRRWHDLPPMQGKLCTPEHVWPRCVEPFVHDGVEVVELCTAMDLWDEGIRMGHCVGGDNYVNSCMRGITRIVSVRIDGEGVSTAEFIPAGNDGDKPKIQQHRGPHNVVPTDRARSALETWRSAVKTGKVKAILAAPVPMPATQSLSLIGYGPAAWRPFIRRDLASMSWEEFGEQVMEIYGTGPEIEGDIGYPW